MGQEPGTNAEIKTFCSTKYDVTFDLFEKVSVKGDGQCDLYKYLTSEDAGHEFGGDVEWNFQKYLVGRDGKLVAKFGPRTLPDAEEVTKAIDKMLSVKPD
jgi:glutathione peroxidase